MRTMLIVAAMVAVLLCIVWTQQRRLMYFPFGAAGNPRDAGLERATAVTFDTSDGLTLKGWFILPPIAPRFSLIVFNGNAGNRAYRAGLARAFVDADIAVFLFDYRGYGGNPGTPSESGLRRDARAARAYVAGRSDVGGKPLVYFGESLGAAVAAELAVEHPPAALILRSPFTSATDVARHHYGFVAVRWLIRDRFSTIDLVERIRAPILVIAGDRDRIVPIDQSRQLYEAANEPKSLAIIQDADHNDESLQGGREMRRTALAFLDAQVK